jgi:bifunctional DNA-binding transcriptional regulator/antitoxin component of YhaV-PrlF toxin-antitoxin module
MVLSPVQESRTNMAIVTKISELGKMNIPVQIRRQTGLERGGPVVMTVVDGEIRLRAVRNVLTSLQRDAETVFAGSGDSVDGFLAERRAEAARDEAATR